MEKFPFLFFVPTSPVVQFWIWSHFCVKVSWGYLFPAQTGGVKGAADWGLWLTQVRGKEQYRKQASLRWQRLAWSCNSLRHAMCSPGEVVLGSQDPGTGRLHRLLGGEVWKWPVLAHRILVGCSSSLSISCLSLVFALIVAAPTCLWSSFRWCSESLFLAHPKTMFSCFSCRSGLFPGLPPS